jgi:hypothetical protein
MDFMPVIILYFFDEFGIIHLKISSLSIIHHNVRKVSPSHDNEGRKYISELPPHFLECVLLESSGGIKSLQG